MTGANTATGKTFSALQARAALAGIELVRTDPRDGSPRFLTQHRGAWRELRSLEDVESVVVQTFANGRTAR